MQDFDQVTHWTVSKLLPFVTGSNIYVCTSRHKIVFPPATSAPESHLHQKSHRFGRSWSIAQRCPLYRRENQCHWLQEFPTDVQPGLLQTTHSPQAQKICDYCASLCGDTVRYPTSYVLKRIFKQKKRGDPTLGNILVFGCSCYHYQVRGNVLFIY